MTTPTPDGLLRRPTTALTPELLESLAAKLLPRRGSTVFLPTLFDECADAMTEAANEIRRLQEIVSRLPRTADGVTIISGMQVFPPCGHAPFVASLLAERHACFTEKCYTRLPDGDSSGRVYSPTECYSARALAAAAAEGAVG